MSIRIDLHCHTWFSRDSASDPEDLIRNAKKNGLDGLSRNAE